MFELTKNEYDFLKYQFGALKRGEHSKYLPMALQYLENSQSGFRLLAGKVLSKAGNRIMATLFLS